MRRTASKCVGGLFLGCGDQIGCLGVLGDAACLWNGETRPGVAQGLGSAWRKKVFGGVFPVFSLTRGFAEV